MEPEATSTTAEVSQEPTQPNDGNSTVVDVQQEITAESQPEPAIVNPEPIPQNPTPIDEIDKAFIVCSDLIDNPPDEYRLVKQAVLGLQHLGARREDLRSIVVLKILQIIRDPLMYRSNPRRFAVQSLGYLTYYDQNLVDAAIQLLTQLLHKKGEGSQYVRKAAYMALSRIGRRYPQYQSTLAPLFLQHYHSTKTKASEMWGVVIGIGRMAQSNAQLRTDFAPEFVKLCSHRGFRMRWAGIKGLGHAVCALDVQNDEVLEEKCYELAMELLKHGGVEDLKQKAELEPDDWKRDELYLSQYAATQGLGLLLRSNPDKWWSRLSPTFGEILLNPKFASMTKAMVMLTYGKIGYYMTPENPYYSGITELLFELTKNPNILVAEPATYGLCNFALAHEELYPKVKEILQSKMHLDSVPLEKVQPDLLLYYLKPWCKLLAKNYNPVMNLCSNVISPHAVGKVAPSAFVSAEFQLTGEGEGTDTIKTKKRPAPTEVPDGSNPNQISEAAVKPIARNNSRLWRLCTQYSVAVIESICLLLTDISTLEDQAFIANLKNLVLQYNTKQLTPSDHNGMINRFDELWKMDVVLRESAVTILKWPEVLDDSTWVSNLKAMIQVIASRPPSARDSKPAAPPRQNNSSFAAAPLVNNPAAPTASVASSTPIDPQLYAMVASILQQPNGAQQLFTFTQQLPPAQAAQIAEVVKQLLGAAATVQVAAPPAFVPPVAPAPAIPFATPAIASLFPQLNPGLTGLVPMMPTAQPNYLSNVPPPTQNYRGGASSGGRGGAYGRSHGPDHRYQHEPYHNRGGGSYRGDRGGRGRGRGGY